MRQFLVKSLVTTSLLSYLCAGTPALAARFVDLDGNWAQRYVNQLSDQGVINAEPDGKFLPDQPVTRAMLAYWLVKVLGIDKQPVSDHPSFPDVKPTDWFYKPVEIIRQNNYISGYADGFRPNQFVQKAEVISILARTLGTPVPDDSAATDAVEVYNDKSRIPPWAKGAIAQATLAGIIVTQTDHVLNPTAIATRADAAGMLSKLGNFVTHKTVNDSEQIAQAASQRTPAAGGLAPYPSQQTFQAQADKYGAPGQYLQTGNAAAAAPMPLYNNAPQYQQQLMQQQQQQQSGGQNYNQGFVPQTNVNPNNGFQPQQNGSMMMGADGGQMLQGQLVTIAPGTQFRAKLDTSLDSGSNKVGDRIEAVISEPIMVDGGEAIPAGTKLIGLVTKVTSAKHFQFGANGSVAFKFSTMETPDGKKMPLSCSIADKSAVKLTGGTTAGRVGKGLMATGVGAGGGALVGGALGMAMAGMRGMPMGRSMGMGALYGGTIGGGAGAVTAGVRKGSEVRILSGQDLPMRLDAGLTVALSQQAMQQQQMQQQQMQQPMQMQGQGQFQNQPVQNQGFQNQGFQQQGFSNNGGFNQNQNFQQGVPQQQDQQGGGGFYQQ